MTTRSAVDNNTILESGITGKSKAKSTVSITSDPSQSGAGASVDDQAIFNKEDTKQQHLVPSKQQVDKSLFEPIEFDDTAELNITDNAERTINKSIVSELFPDHSTSIIGEHDVILNTSSYPDTLEECIQVINSLRQREKSLHLINTENNFFWAACSRKPEVSNIFYKKNI